MPCPICEGPHQELDPALHLYWCRSCQHTFTLLPADKQEKYASNYFDEGHKRWFENPDIGLFQRVERTLLPHVARSEIRLLDAGCGRGDFLRWLHPRQPHWQLTGIDFAPNQHPAIQFIQGDLYQAALNGPFDVITTFMVVEHLENIRPFFDRMRQLLTPNGILMVNTFNNDSMMFRLARTLNRLGIHTAYQRLYSPHHVQHYSKHSIREILLRSGFDILQHQCHNYPLKAVDVPPARPIVEWAYRLCVGLVFALSGPLGQGIEHTLFCRPRTAPAGAAPRLPSLPDKAFQGNPE